MTFVDRYDTQHYVLEDQLQVPSSAVLTGLSGLRWGQDGLAYLVTSGLGGSSPSQIMVLRGPFVLPAEASTNFAPGLSSIGSGTVSAGGPNQWLAVTGTGFMPGASVVWNGVIHDTTFTDSQHVSVAVGAADIKTAGSVTITVRNPGSVDSNSVTLTVQ